MKKVRGKKRRQTQELLPKTRKDRSSAELTVDIELPTLKLANIICNSILPETIQPGGFRSKTTVSQQSKVLRLHIAAEDITALRAASNSFLRFVSVAMKTLNVVAPFYRADNSDASETIGKLD